MVDIVAERDSQFEQRKRDHLRIALDQKAQSVTPTGLDSLELIHEALPDLNFEDLDLKTSFENRALNAPFFISSMTAGHEKGREINFALARLSAERKILMGVGSQRRELEDPAAASEWKEVRKQAPDALLLGNLGLAQVIRSSVSDVQALVENVGALALFIHLNPLQECLQPEGTPQFRGGLGALEKLAKALSVPVIVKETGCGFSVATLQRLDGIGIKAVDVSGLGGTHWGRVETERLETSDFRPQSGAVFNEWGTTTLQSMLNAAEAHVSYQVWASGGVRTGLDVAKLISVGAEFVGLAQPWLQAAVSENPDQELNRVYERLEFELKTSLFCTGARTPEELRTGRRSKWPNA